MRPLFVKELRHLAPIALFFCVLLGADLIEIALTAQVLEASWFSAHLALETEPIYWICAYFMGIIFAYSLFPREYEDRTIEFLHTLPITRKQLFWSKWAAATCLIALVFALTEVGAFSIQLFNHNSLTSGEFSLSNSLKLYLKALTLASVGLAHGLLLSLARYFGIFLLFLAGWCASQIESKFPQINYLSPLSMGENTFYGTHLSLPWEIMGFHLALALVSLLVAEYFWSRRGHQSTRVFHKLKDWPKLVGCLSFFACFVLFLAWAVSSDEGDYEVTDQPRFETFESARVATEHYHFTFPLQFREAALGLASRADGLYQNAFEHLGEAGRQDLIVGDLTNVSDTHLGIAAKGKLRMDITANKEDGLLDHILCHETCHVLAYRLSGKRGERYGNLLSTFHEGTASYYAYSLTESSRDLGDSRRQALALQKLHKLKLEDLFDSDALQKRLDDGAKYALGEVWVAAIVDAYGPKAPAKIWKAVARVAPDDLQGEVFWRDTFQAAGLSLEKVRAAWEARFKALEAQERDWLKSLPKLSVRAERDEDDDIMIVGEADKAFAESWPGLVLRVRKSGADTFETLPLDSDPDGRTARAWPPYSYGNEFEYQVGIVASEGGYAIVNEWREAKNL